MQLIVIADLQYVWGKVNRIAIKILNEKDKEEERIIMPVKGYDCFYSEPDSHEEMVCKVCGTTCDVERSVIGPTGWAEGMAGRGHWHDKFQCPHRNSSWHKTALELVMEIEKTPSKRVAELMQQDLDELLDKNGCGVNQS